MRGSPRQIGRRVMLGYAAWLAMGLTVMGDGMVMPPRDYKGSLEELAQEAILIFHPGDEKRGATEDMILKIQVQGDVDRFAWIIPFPSEPTTAPEDPALFVELHRYVQARLAARSFKPAGDAKLAKSEAPSPAPEEAPVEVLSRKVVGSFDVAIVRENKAGALIDWLIENQFRAPEAAEDVIGSYRKKGYVFACVKVSDAAKGKGTDSSLHPLRFTFKTGGRDGIYFPMRLTGLQSAPFDVNLYVFYDKWINDRISRFGYTHRGFSLIWRDYDTPACVPNAGKSWTDPSADPYLKGYESFFPTITKVFQKLHPGARYYLTNIRATGLKAIDVRAWSDDLWLFPYYTDPKMVPLDAREGGPAAAGFPVVPQVEVPPKVLRSTGLAYWLAGAALFAAGSVVAFLRLARYRGNRPAKPEFS